MPEWKRTPRSKIVPYNCTGVLGFSPVQMCPHSTLCPHWARLSLLHPPAA